jgi:hypothetical protein
MIDAFAGTVNCADCDLAPCGGDGTIDVGDILAVLDAFSGTYACPHAPAHPEPGPGRPWEGELAVATFSSVNLRHGNVFTEIPIVGWSGRGPSLSISLYHNSANVDSTLPLTRSIGFDLGPGWTISYSAQILFDPPQSPLAKGGVMPSPFAKGGVITPL